MKTKSRNSTLSAAFFLFAILFAFLSFSGGLLCRASGGDELIDTAVYEERSVGEVIEQLILLHEKQSDSGVFSAEELRKALDNLYGIRLVRDENMKEIIKLLETVALVHDPNSTYRPAAETYRNAIERLEKIILAKRKELERQERINEMLNKQTQLLNELQQLMQEKLNLKLDEKAISKLMELAARQDELREMAEAGQMQELAERIKEAVEKLKNADMKEAKELQESIKKALEEMLSGDFEFAPFDGPMAPMNFDGNPIMDKTIQQMQEKMQQMQKQIDRLKELKEQIEKYKKQFNELQEKKKNMTADEQRKTSTEMDRTAAGLRELAKEIQSFEEILNELLEETPFNGDDWERFDPSKPDQFPVFPGGDNAAEHSFPAPEDASIHRFSNASFLLCDGSGELPDEIRELLDEFGGGENGKKNPSAPVPGGNNAPDDVKAGEKINRAADHVDDGIGNMIEDAIPDASGDMQKALKELEDAQKKMEEDLQKMKDALKKMKQIGRLIPGGNGGAGAMPIPIPGLGPGGGPGGNSSGERSPTGDTPPDLRGVLRPSTDKKDWERKLTPAEQEALESMRKAGFDETFEEEVRRYFSKLAEEKA